MAAFNEKDAQKLFTFSVLYILGVVTGLVNSDVTINIRMILIPVSIFAIIGAFMFNRKSEEVDTRRHKTPDYKQFSR